MIIYKTSVEQTDCIQRVTIKLQRGSKILNVGIQIRNINRINFWYLVPNINADIVERNFLIVGTGIEIEDDFDSLGDHFYYETPVGEVYHVFELLY